jgi:hypothetical protein
MFKDSFDKLETYITKENFSGYDPYDTLISWVPFHVLGKWGPVLGIQFQKRNPINIRPLLGIPKGYNPKAMGLFLLAYSILYKKTQTLEYKQKADFFFKWLCENYSEGYSGFAWGYNFPWASPVKYLKPFVPSAVVTGFVCRGLYEYYQIEPSNKVKGIIKGASAFIKKDLEWTKDKTGICISYTPEMKDICYNASLLAAEVLAYNYELNGIKSDAESAIKAVEFVISRQKKDGLWAYSEGKNGTERIQTDFHQGYVLESLYRIQKVLNATKADDQVLKKLSGWSEYIHKGLVFYKENQFDRYGRSFWRLPKKWPIEIHNQAQGIITFKLLEEIAPEYSTFANIILNYTIEKMQDQDGHFYYQGFKYHTNRISYMRWSQAWMFLSMAVKMENRK